MPEPLSTLLSFILNQIDPRTPTGWRMVIIVFLVSALIYSIFDRQGIVVERDTLKSTNENLVIANQNYKNDNLEMSQQLGVLGISTEESQIPLRTSEDFNASWDTSNFYLDSEGFLCPRPRGGNNYQRMTYIQDTPLVSTEFDLKFQMKSQNGYNSSIDYKHLVAGAYLDGSVLFEYDLPVEVGQIVNFRVPSADHESDLIPGAVGRSLNAPIKNGSNINIVLQSQLKHEDEVTEIFSVSYKSDYGIESDSFSNDVKVNDPDPVSLMSNPFIGTYIGGCIKVISWSVK